MKIKFFLTKLSLLFISLFSFQEALAEPAKPWQMGFQAPVSPVMEKFEQFHTELMYIITGVTLLVVFLLAYVIIKFNKKANPVPSKTSHNTLIEIIWTTIPIIILIVIAIPSFKVLYYSDKLEKADLTLKVIGHQWYWEYQYPDYDNVTFDSYMIKDKDLKPGQLRLLEVDNRVVLPVNTNIRILTTAADVMHSWAVPAFGVKIDAIPGRVNETWVKVTKPGVYYGQCSELCGVDHGFMPIAIEVKSKEDFEIWAAEAKKKFASSSTNSLVALDIKD
jgi:cytochrome c oxidase subunit 2